MKKSAERTVALDTAFNKVNLRYKGKNPTRHDIFRQGYKAGYNLCQRELDALLDPYIALSSPWTGAEQTAIRTILTGKRSHNGGHK